MDRARIRVLCVDDSTRLTDAWARLFRLQPDLEFVGALQSADTLLEAVTELKPDVVLMDLTMDGRDPLESITELRKTNPQARVIVCTGHSDPRLMAQALDAGAWGYASKAQEPSSIVNEIRRVAGSESLSP